MVSSYAYASGKIRALEPKILDAVDIERMVNAPDFREAFKVLNDTDYAENLLAVAPEQYRDALHDNYNQLHELIRQLSPKRALFELIFIERDFVNLKLLFKEKFHGIPVQSFSNCTVYPIETLRTLVNQENQFATATLLAEIIKNADEMMRTDARPERIDDILTKQYYAYLQHLVKKIGSQLITEYVAVNIDNANVIITLRSRRLGLDKTVVAQKMIPGGHIPASRLLDDYQNELKAIRSQIDLRYDQAVLESFDQYCEKNLLYDFERALEDYKTRFIRQSRMIAYGPEVIFAYYIAKQNAISNIRIIMTGKLNDIPADEIKKTIRIVR